MLGICIVFLLADEWGEFLARTVVTQIERTTLGPYRIYGLALRSSESQIEYLEQLNVNFLSVPQPQSAQRSGSKEHSFLLDQLVAQALREGCDHVVTFDMDSWPVMVGWDKTYSAILSTRTPVAAIVRTELTDNFPFAAFTMFPSWFWKDGLSSFASENDNSLSRRPGETGSGILDQLAQENLCFFRLERTNRWNPHPLIAGIYDDAFFHLGAGSRSAIFVSDDAHYGLNGSALRRDFAMAINGAIRDWVLGSLQTDHDGFIAELVNGNRMCFQPIKTIACDTPHETVLTDWSVRISAHGANGALY